MILSVGKCIIRVSRMRHMLLATMQLTKSTVVFVGELAGEAPRRGPRSTTRGHRSPDWARLVLCANGACHDFALEMGSAGAKSS